MDKPGGSPLAATGEVNLPTPDVCTREQIRPLLREPSAADQLPEVLYWMYRDVHQPRHAHLRRQYGLRYDISVFRGCLMGSELFKTRGHYHPYLHWRYPISYPEVYEVLYGEAFYLLQKVDDIYRDPFYVRVEDVILVHARPGQKVVVPPNYGHVSINAKPQQPLVMSNWVCDYFASYFDSVRQAHGFAYYCLAGEGGQPRWVANPTYRQPLPPIRRASPCEAPAIGLGADTPIYCSAVEAPEKFAWLCYPQQYLAEIWAALELVS
jgi:glucose-6-phosphate isomerase